jgi:hypothetical protein
MREMTQEEFEDRAMALHRARKIFVETGLTKNISKAFEAYQGLFAERERRVFLSSQVDHPPTIMDRYERPQCPDCGSDMRIRVVPENPEGIKTQLVCTKCDTVLNDEHGLQWWMDNLRKKNDVGSQGVSGGAEAIEQGG